MGLNISANFYKYITGLITVFGKNDSNNKICAEFYTNFNVYHSWETIE